MRTPLAGGLVGASMLFLLGALIFRNWQLVFVALSPLIFVALGSLVPSSPPALSAERVVSRDRLEVGSTTEIGLTLRNEGSTFDLVEVLDTIPAEFVLESGTNHAVVPLPPGDSLTLAYTVRPDVKGEYALGPVRARALDPLGLSIEDSHVPIRTRVVVAPVMEDVRAAELTPPRTRHWFGQIPSHRPGPGSEFWAVREYVPGDEVRRINWKASARLDRMLTNEVEGERSGDVILVLDARRESFVGTPTDNPVEHGVRAALGIADFVLSSRNRVGLVVQRTFLDRVLPAFGKKQLYRILDSLIQVRAGGEWPFSHVATVLSRYFPTDALVVLISPLLDRTALEAVIGLRGRGYGVLIVSPSPLEVERGLSKADAEQEIAYRLLRVERENLLMQLGRVAHVVDWDPSTPLAVTLRRLRPSPRAA